MYLSLLAVGNSSGLLAQDNQRYTPSGMALEKGVALYDSGAFQKAIAVLGTIDRNDTNYVKAMYNIGLCYFADSQFDKSIAINQQALDAAFSDPEKVPDILNQYGNSVDAAGSTEKALKIFDSAIGQYPGYSLFYQNKGTMLTKLKRYPEAEATLQKCLLIDPYSYSAHFKLGIAALNQGKLIPAMLCFIGYLLNNPEGKYHGSCVGYLKAIAANTDLIQGLVSTRPEQPSPSWELLEQIVQSKIALDAKYKPAVEPDDPILRQIQVVMEKMEYDPADSDFYMQYYVPRFKACWDRQQFAVFINRAFYAIDVPALNDFRKKNKKILEQFVDTLATYFNTIRSTRILNAIARDTAAFIWSHSHGELSGHGKYVRTTDKYVGPWEHFYSAGNIRARGNYNDMEQEDGWWTYYYFNGAVRSKIRYTDGKRDDHSTYYFEDGTVSATSQYQQGLAEGETKVFYPIGTLKQLIHFHADKQEGLKYFFYDNGDTSGMESWSNGELNGPIKSWNTEGHIDRAYQYVNGKLEGPYLKYFANGQIETQGSYSMDEQDGLWRDFFTSGKLQSDQNFVSGKREGVFTERNDSGVVLQTLPYHRGKLEGEAHFIDDDGKPYATYRYENGLLRHATWLDKSGQTIDEANRSGNQITLTTHYPDGPKRMEVHYNSQDNIEGTETDYYPSGQKQSVATYRDGKREGPGLAWYSDGTRRDQFFCSDGKLNGLRTEWYSNGQIKDQGYYKDDELCGLWKSYDDLGALSDTKYFSNGIISGFSDEFWPTGRLRYEFFYKEGWLLAMTQFDSAGKVMKKSSLSQGSGSLDLIYPDGKPYVQSRYVRGKLDGKDDVLYPDGRKMVEQTYVRGNLEGASRTYFHTGQVHEEGQYLHGVKTGTWKAYYRTGKIQNSQEWVDGKKTGMEVDYYENGTIEYRGNFKEDLKSGAASRFDPDGTLAYEINYRNDIPVSYTYLDKDGKRLAAIPIIAQASKIKTYYPNGKLSAEFEYRDGVLTGLIKAYYDNGQLKASWTLVAGVMNGDYTAYYKNGQSKSERKYVNDNLHGAYKEYNEKGIVVERGTTYLNIPHGITQYYDDGGKLTETTTSYYGNIISIQ